MLLGEIHTFRRLVPAFFFGNSVFCWECSLCHKLFMPIPYDYYPSAAQLAQISAEFHQHDCAIQFAVSHDRLKRVLSA